MVKWTFSILFLELLDVFFGHAAGPPFLQWSVMPPAPWVAKPPNAPILGVSWGGNHGREPIIDWRIWFQHVSTITTYPLVICYIAIENGYLYWIYPLKMVILDSYVSLPEGIITWGLLKTWNVFPKVPCWGARDHPTYRYFLTRGSQFRTSMIDMRYCGCEILH